MEKFWWVLLFYRLFPAPIWLRPFGSTGTQGSCGTSAGGIFGERETCLPAQSVRLLSFPLGPNLDSSAFSCLWSHCNTPPARHGAECETVKSVFFLALPFFLSSSIAPWFPHPPHLKPAIPEQHWCTAPSLAHLLPLLTLSSAVKLLVPNRVVKTKTELVLSSCLDVLSTIPAVLPRHGLHLHKTISKPQMETEQRGHVERVCSERKCWR